ncbi:hypothetical protein [Candidatus Nitrotoga sp. M5]|uniref:hypothetical protein n=1 Tax=Candidatus Nitrotoga sp. M5 TaxID=2890409 RepID=UPI001EF1DBC0|nr:hypothetical protein [Candidatus Nitrotoga sp. M5]CAH1386621.1 hypothetical protein NTGM5_30130 [Candidatus Nitrotoga sp. M5]
MRTHPQRTAYVAIKSAVASIAIIFSGLAQTKQARRNKHLKKVTGRAIWFKPSTLTVTKNHTEVKVVIATQKLIVSDLSAPILCIAR